jgi:DNA-binding transcriptional regulator YhcF (GntR family)
MCRFYSQIFNKMEMTTLKQLIDFNDKLISENGNEMTAYEIHQKVIRKAAELLEQEKEIIETAFNDGYRNGTYDRGKLGSEYYVEIFGDVS